jgi:hypothetical protein
MATAGGSELDVVKFFGHDDSAHASPGQPVPDPLIDQYVEPALPVSFGVVSGHSASINVLHDPCEMISILRIQHVQ